MTLHLPIIHFNTAQSQIVFVVGVDVHNVAHHDRRQQLQPEYLVQCDGSRDDETRAT